MFQWNMLLFQVSHLLFLEQTAFELSSIFDIITQTLQESHSLAMKQFVPSDSLSELLNYSSTNLTIFKN